MMMKDKIINNMWIKLGFLKKIIQILDDKKSALMSMFSKLIIHKKNYFEFFFYVIIQNCK